MNIRYPFYLFAIFALLNSPMPATAFEAPPGCGKDCASCHTLTKDEASQIFKSLKVEVLGISDAPSKGLWEINCKMEGKDVKIYLDYGKKYALDIRAFIPVDKIGKAPEPKILDVKSIPQENSMVVGVPLAKNRFYVFSDPDCPYCRKFHDEMKKVVKLRKDIAFYVKLFPLTQIHPQSYEKSKSVVCKNSLELLDDAFSGKEVPKATCGTTVLDDNIKLAAKLGIGGTPAIVFPDGRLVPGYMEADKLLKMLDAGTGK